MAGLVAELALDSGFSKDDVFILGVRTRDSETGKYDAHAVALIRVGNTMWVIDPANHTLESAGEYFSSILGSTTIVAPAYLVTLDDKLVAVYGPEGPMINAKPVFLDNRVDLGDNNAWNAALRLLAQAERIPKKPPRPAPQ